MKLFVDVLVLLHALLLFNLPVVASVRDTSPTKRKLQKGIKGSKDVKGKTGGTNKFDRKGGSSGVSDKDNKGGSGGNDKNGGNDKSGGNNKDGGNNKNSNNKDDKYGDPSDFGNNFAPELYPCIPWDAAAQEKSEHPSTDPECTTNSCAGCCRDYSYLVCDEFGQMPYMRCICGNGAFGNAPTSVGGTTTTGVTDSTSGVSGVQVVNTGTTATGGTVIYGNDGESTGATVVYGGDSNGVTGTGGASLGSFQVVGP